MYQRFPKMIAVIQTRRSCRQFIHTQLAPDHEELISHFMVEMITPFEHHVSITYHLVPDEMNSAYFRGPRQFVALSA
jgi:hypothetical protein